MTRALTAAVRLNLLLVKVTITGPFRVVHCLRRLVAFGKGAVLLLVRNDAYCGYCGATLVLTARWRCKRCGYVWLGHGFSACPLCAEPCAFLNCQSCGTSIRNPLP